MMAALLMMLPFALTSCGDDEDDAKAFVKITVLNGGTPQSGITVYMFDSQTANVIGFSTLHSQKSVATGSDGVATFELGEFDFDVIDSQTTLYFVTFTKDASGKEYQSQAVITIKKGETKSATINIGGTTTYDNGGTTGGNTSTSKKYSIKQVVKETVMTVHSQTYTGSASNRSYVTVQLLKNTVSWYYAVSSQFAETGTPTLGLLGGLMKYLDPASGLLANNVSSLSAPTGTADVNVYFMMDIENLNIFNDKSGQFTTYV